MVDHERPIVTTAGITLAALTMACQADQAAATAPNHVTYHIDGVPVPAENVMPLAALDRTKQMLGPNTHHYLEALNFAAAPDSISGDKLRFNVPAGMTPGTYPLRSSAFPTREHLWLEYRQSKTETWTGYDGVIEIRELGGVGSRLVARFDSVKLSNSCGEERLLEHGLMDVRVGSEDVFPESEIEKSDEWREIAATERIENNLVARVDDITYACEFVDFGKASVSAEDSGLGQEETVLSVIGICGCDDANGDRRWTATIAAYWPSEGHGTIATDRHPFHLFLQIDFAGTPTVFDDDETWYSSLMELEYHAVGLEPRSPVNIELLRPIELFYVDRQGENWTLDKSSSKTLSYVHVYGNVVP